MILYQGQALPFVLSSVSEPMGRRLVCRLCEAEEGDSRKESKWWAERWPPQKCVRDSSSMVFCFLIKFWLKKSFSFYFTNFIFDIIQNAKYTRELVVKSLLIPPFSHQAPCPSDSQCHYLLCPPEIVPFLCINEHTLWSEPRLFVCFFPLSNLETSQPWMKAFLVLIDVKLCASYLRYVPCLT